MKLLMQGVLVVAISVLYMNSITNNYKIPEIKDDEPDPISTFVNEFSVIGLVEDEILRLQQEKDIEELELHRELEKQKTIKRDKVEKASRGEVDRGIFTATSYDLTIASCGKASSHPQYGITKSGYSLKGHNRESAMTIATDPKVIPLGTNVKLEFLDEEWSHWDGIYVSRDTGSAIKGKIIDVFFKDTGDSKTEQELWNFGRRKVKVTIIK